jgi:hemerythrin
MALLDWNESYSVGVAVFDGQHKKLFALVNDLNDGMKAGKGKEALGKVLDGLISYTATHFAAEEKMMNEHQYLQAFAHKSEHDKLVKQVLKLQEDYKAGKAMLSLEMMSFLKDWLYNHIMGTDKKYGVFFNGKGIK